MILQKIYLHPKESQAKKLTLSASTSDIISLIVSSSPIPYSFMADCSSSLVINLQMKSQKDLNIFHLNAEEPVHICLINENSLTYLH